MQFLCNVTALSTNQIFASLVSEVLWDVVYHLCFKASVCFIHDLTKAFNTLSEVCIGRA